MGGMSRSGGGLSADGLNASVELEFTISREVALNV